MKYNLVIWDWNGTLLDDVSASLRSVNDMLARREMPPITIERYRECIGVPIRCFYEQVFDIENEDYPSLLKEYNDGYEYYVSLDCGVAKGAVGLLEKISKSGAKQIIVSSCEKSQLVAAVVKAGVADYFDAILGADDFFATSKVDRAKEYIAKNYSFAPSVIAVGDLLHDLELACSVGADCVLVESGHEDTNRLHSSNAMIAADIAHIEKYFEF